MTQAEFLNHRKREHKQYVPKCRNAEIGTCTYDKFCWFSHEIHECDKKIRIKNNEVFEKNLNDGEKDGKNDRKTYSNRK